MEYPEFLIPLNGLASGRTEFRWKAGKEFFGSFGNAEILDADLTAVAAVEKSGHDIAVDCSIEGTVTVLCDRCLDDLVLPVSVVAGLDVKYGRQPVSGSGDTEDGSEARESVYVQASEQELDMSQIIYDYVCLSLPMQRFHPEGQCNPESVARLRAGISVKGTEQVRNPFAALEGFLGDSGEQTENNN